MTARNGDDGLIAQYFTEIGIIHQLATAQFQRLIGPDLSINEFGVLNHFARLGDGTTPSRLARIFQVTKPSMTGILGKLETKGYVRIEGCADDKRRKLVRLTPAGKAAQARAVEAASPVFHAMLDDFGIGRLAAALPDLQALRAHLDRARNGHDALEDGPPPGTASV